MPGPRRQSPKVKHRSPKASPKAAPRSPSFVTPDAQLPPDSALLEADDAPLEFVDPIHLEALRSIVTAPEPEKDFASDNKRRATSMNELRGVDEYTYVDHYQAHVETFAHWMLIIARGISGKCKILFYDLRHLVQYGGVATAHLEGTLFTMDISGLVFVGFLSMAFTLVFIMTWSVLDGGTTMDTEPLEKIANTMNQVVPFVLGSYVAVALKRWWTVRNEGLAEIFNAITNITMLVACIMHPERLKPVRTLTLKWSFASVFLLLKAVRGQSNLQDMLHKSLLSEEEINILMKIADLHARPAVLWAWVLRLVHESFSQAVGPMPYSIQTSKAAEIIMSASSGLSVIDMHLRTALPFVYVHLITLLVDVQTLVLVAKTGVVAAQAYHEGEMARCASQYVFCVIVPTLYRGLLSISYAIFDPFGEDILDFPVASFLDWNASCCYAVLQAQERFPGVPESVYAVSKRKFVAATDKKLSLADPERFARTKANFRAVIINAYRNGKLELTVHKELLKRQAEKAKPQLARLTNAKSNAAVLAATAFATPVAAELRIFGKAMRDQLIVLRNDVYQLQKAVDDSGSRQRYEVQRAVGIVDFSSKKAQLAEEAPYQSRVESRPQELAEESAGAYQIREDFAGA